MHDEAWCQEFKKVFSILARKGIRAYVLMLVDICEVALFAIHNIWLVWRVYRPNFSPALFAKNDPIIFVALDALCGVYAESVGKDLE